jgi:hypothetical protein
MPPVAAVTMWLGSLSRATPCRQLYTGSLLGTDHGRLISFTVSFSLVRRRRIAQTDVEEGVS